MTKRDIITGVRVRDTWCPDFGVGVIRDTKSKTFVVEYPAVERHMKYVYSDARFLEHVEVEVEEYDSTEDTKAHIAEVQSLLADDMKRLFERAIRHDASKFSNEEKPYFDRETPLLQTLTYGSPEYTEALDRLGPALRHHYAYNSHHPQHYPNGILGMDLYDLLEMVDDWAASVKRTKGGDIVKSLEINRNRFNIPEPLFIILQNHIIRYHIYEKH